MKKKLTAIILTILMVTTTAGIFTACKGDEQLKVTYTTDGNGTIQGQANQTITKGKDASTVTAMPNTGYEFDKWLDNNSTNATRTDTNITKNINAKATFKLVEETGLTAEQQVQIAKDTFNGIYNAIQEPQTQLLMARMSLTEEDEGVFNDLFDKYADKANNVNIIGQCESAYYLITQPITELLNSAGASTLNYEYEVEYNIINSSGGSYDYLPNKLSFHGVQAAGEYNKVYTTAILTDQNLRYTVISYYKSANDYNFEFYSIKDDEIIGYVSFDKLTNTVQYITLSTIANNTKEIYLTELTQEEKESIFEIMNTGKTNITTAIENLEKDNNNGMLKSFSTIKPVLDFDASRV